MYRSAKYFALDHKSEKNMSTQTKEVQSCSSGGNTAPASVPCVCRVCGGALEAKEQLTGIPDKPAYWIVTCWNRACALGGYTRSVATYATFDLTPYIEKA